MARRGHAFFFRYESSIVPHVNRRFIGRTRPRGCFLAPRRKVRTSGGRDGGARSIERGCFGQTRSRCGCRSVYTQHSSVENEKKKGWAASRKKERERQGERARSTIEGHGRKRFTADQISTNRNENQTSPPPANPIPPPVLAPPRLASSIIDRIN